MNTFLVFTANTALLIALVCFIAYLVRPGPPRQ